MLVIKAAAVKIGKGERAKLVIGKDHGECFKQLTETELNSVSLVQGFITSRHEFVGRKEAAVIAREACQSYEATKEDYLISEQLWLFGPCDWDSEQQCYIKTRKRLNDI